MQTNTSRHPTSDACPRCTTNTLDHVHCAHPGCEFHIQTCSDCDSSAAVNAFMADHTTKCDRMPLAARVTQLLAQRAVFAR